LWPDFDRRELLKAVLEFQSRDRRFGGLTPVVEPEEKASIVEAEEIAVSSK
jgi:hypothetical protein